MRIAAAGLGRMYHHTGCWRAALTSKKGNGKGKGGRDVRRKETQWVEERESVIEASCEKE
jgi:hypothetical protein